jgi:hypothetical protein
LGERKKEYAMWKNARSVVIALGFLALPLLVLSRSAQQLNSLIISGQSGQAKVIQVGGRNYVDVEGLTRISNGSTTVNGDRIVLTLPPATATAVANAAPPATFSKEFLATAIEAMSQVREWHATLKNAIERGYPISEEWIDPLRRQAQQNVKLAGVNANTDADRKLLPFLTNAFSDVNTLSQEYMKMTKNMEYIAANSLTTDPAEQKLLACGHSIATMAASNQFTDDASCR